MSHLHKIRVGHAYDGRVWGDGARVLVDRLWPRGLSHVRADLDEWCKTVAPSVELRTWYGHDPELFEQFRERYRTELEDPERIEAVRHLRTLAKRRNVTLLTASRRLETSHAIVLVDLLGEHGDTG